MRPTCAETAFCARALLDFNQTAADAPSTSYTLDASTIQINDSEASLNARLTKTSGSKAQPEEESFGHAGELDLTLWFYQNGIMRALIQEPDSDRFRISQEELAVADSQLEPVTSLSSHF